MGKLDFPEFARHLIALQYNSKRGVYEQWKQYDEMREYAFKIIKESRQPQNIATQISLLVHNGLELYSSASNYSDRKYSVE